MGDLPSGTLTFLFTDLEGSTALWESEPEAMREAVARHDELLADAVRVHHGVVVKTTGDGMVAVFVNATDGVAAALACQLALASSDWAVPIKARIGLYSGEAEAHDGDYHAPVLNRAARVMSAGHGGQVLLASSTAGLAARSLPVGVELTELGEHRLRDLGQPETLFQLCHPDLPRRFAPLRTLDAHPGNLPLQVSSFIGRDEQLVWCREALVESRVLTLTGVGGVGKTRLAMQVAARVVPDFRDGAWLVELAPVRDRSGVAEAVVTALGVPPGSEDTESLLVDALGAKQVLLVLDNCEHVLSGVSTLVKRIIQACPEVKVLATSREGMAIVGERLMAVPPLEIGDPDDSVEAVLASEAVELFVERARAVNAEFDLGPDNAGAVVEICRRLDGVPLAIELAAARVIALGPQDLARRLDRRFQMLAGGRRGAVERHATLRAAIDWSYGLLAEAEKTMLARLSVFAGSFDLDAAEAVCSGGPVDAEEALDTLTALVAQSLVVADQRSLGTRYRLLETIRQYGEEQLEADEIASLRDRHAGHYADFLQQSSVGLWAFDDLTAAQNRAMEIDNVLAAHGHALDTASVDAATRLVVFHDWSALGELRIPPAAPVVALPGASDHPLFPVVLLRAALQSHERGDHDTTDEYYNRAVAAFRPGHDSMLDALFEPAAAWIPAMRLLDSGRYDAAARAFNESAELDLRHGQPAIAAVRRTGAVMAREWGGLDAELTMAIAEQAAAEARQSGSPIAIALTSAHLAGVLAEDSRDQATRLLASALRTVALPGQQNSQQMAGMSLIALKLAHLDLALAISIRVLWLNRWHPHEAFAAGQFACCARAVAESDPETAAVLVGASYAAFRRASPDAKPSAAPRSRTRGEASTNPAIQALRETYHVVSEALGPEANALRARGLDMDLDQAVSYALAHITAQSVLAALDDLEAASSALNGDRL